MALLFSISFLSTLTSIRVNKSLAWVLGARALVNGEFTVLSNSRIFIWFFKKKRSFRLFISIPDFRNHYYHVFL